LGWGRRPAAACARSDEKFEHPERNRAELPAKTEQRKTERDYTYVRTQLQRRCARSAERDDRHRPPPRRRRGMRSRIRAADHDPRDALNACREATAGRAPSPRGKRKRTRERGGVVRPRAVATPLVLRQLPRPRGPLTARSGGRGAAGPVMALPVLQLQGDQSSGELPGRERRWKT